MGWIRPWKYLAEALAKMSFPFGKAPLWLFILSILSALALAIFGPRAGGKADLTFTLFHQKHLDAYLPVIEKFEREHGVKVQVQLVDVRALPYRIKNAYMSGVGMPDLVELESSTFGFFTKGPLEDMAFLDLTDRLAAEGLAGKLVKSRLDGLSTRGRIFGIPHDVHPVMLLYRKDILAEMGIDPDSIRTWEEFTKVGKRLTRDLDGDGEPDRFAVDMPDYGGDWLNLLMLQRGGSLFDEHGKLTIDSEAIRETILWYIHQISGPDRIAFPAGWGQGFYSAMQDGVVAFVFAPDWRAAMIEDGAPGLRGKLGMMPLPAWYPGGRRTSVHGGTGLMISRQCARPDLAWDLAKALYFDPEALNRSFSLTNTVSARSDFWNLPAMNNPNPFFSNELVGRRYAALAAQTPSQFNTPYNSLAGGKVAEAMTQGRAYYEAHGDAGLREFVGGKLREGSAYVESIMKRNVFLAEPESASP